MYKEGDRVKTIEKIQPHTKEGPIAVEGVVSHVGGDDVQVKLDVQTEYGRREGYGTLRYFKLADLLAYDVLRFSPGDKVTTTSTRSNGGRLLTPGDVYSVEEVAVFGSTSAGIRRVGDGVYVYVPRSTCTKVDEETKAGQEKPLGWTFRATDSTFDGARVLRELDEAGADYAVIEWQGSWVAVIHERIAARAASVGVTKLLGCSWTYGRLTQLNPLIAKPDGSSYRLVYSRGGACSGAVSLAEVKAMVDELIRLEARAKKFRVHVAYGKVGE